MNKIKVGIVGYGNLGRGVQDSIMQNQDMELVAVFSRRQLNNSEVNAPCFLMDEIINFKDKIDVLILCGGSFEDLPKQAPELAKHFNTIDSFDTHAKIPEYFKNVDKSAKEGNNIAMISVGWDPGLFSLNRVYADSVLPVGKTYTFWGKGLSQGHSDAIRRVDGVKYGVQYTIPKKEVIDNVRAGKNPELSSQESHDRECFIVAKDGADKDKIANEIKNMPNYFKGYNTTVNFIDEEEFKRNHSTMPHGGFVIRSGKSEKNSNLIYEFSLNLDSNPEFTASVLVAYTRAVYRMKKLGMSGAMSVFDVAPSMLSQKSNEELRRDYL